MNGKYTRRKFLGASTGALAGGVVGGLAVGGVVGYLLGQNTTSPTIQTVAQTVTRTVQGPGITITQTATVAPQFGRRLKTAIVVPGRASDVSWNQVGVESLRRAATKYRAEFFFTENIGYGEPPQRAIEDYIRRGVDLIVPHASGYRTIAKNIVQNRQQGNSKLLIVASAVGEVLKEDLVKDTVATYSFEASEGGYIAGYLAGLVSKTGVIGIVQSIENNSNWLRQSGGFAQGVKDANPNAKILFSVIGSFEDAVKAKEFTLAHIAKRADVIFGLGDGASLGILEACTEKNVWFIDVIGDKRAIDKGGVLLTSILWDFTPAYDQAVADIYTGTFGETNYELSMFNGGIRLLTINPKIPVDIITKLQEPTENVLTGKKKVERILTPDKFYDLLARLGLN